MRNTIGNASANKSSLNPSARLLDRSILQRATLEFHRWPERQNIKKKILKFRVGRGSRCARWRNSLNILPRHLGCVNRLTNIRICSRVLYWNREKSLPYDKISRKIYCRQRLHGRKSGPWTRHAPHRSAGKFNINLCLLRPVVTVSSVSLSLARFISLSISAR